MTLEELKEELEDRLDEDVDSLTAKDRVSFFLNISEFYIAKLQRASAAPVLVDDTEITITVINTKEDLDED